MRFHGLMLLRDEGDIIAQTLEHLLRWIDGLYVLDLGSTDDTWEIVQQYASRDKRIVPFEHAPILYDDNLRSYIFHHFRERFHKGDWIMKIDADEIYHVEPPTFVRERLRSHESAVHLQWYFFRLTQQEVADYESGRVDVLEDRKRPISERRRYYKVSEYAEPRMFTYRPTMQWPQNVSFPFNAGYVARERIPILHYPHRDPLQMEKRFQLRARMMQLKAHAGGHWKLEDWRKEIVDELGASAAMTSGVGLSDNARVDTGSLRWWEPGTPLREEPHHGHWKRDARRAMQRLLYATVPGILDRRRPRFDMNYRPAASPF